MGSSMTCKQEFCCGDMRNCTGPTQSQPLPASTITFTDQPLLEVTDPNGDRFFIATLANIGIILNLHKAAEERVKRELFANQKTSVELVFNQRNPFGLPHAYISIYQPPSK